MVSSLSVVVCTRDRAPHLGQTLKSLGEMLIPSGLVCEVVIVDNNSSDDTKRVVEEFAMTPRLKVRYVFEPHAGLPYARNAALSAARGQVIAFTDDDCLVDRNWVHELVREFHADSAIDMIFGKTKKSSTGQFSLSVKDTESREYFSYPTKPWVIGHGNNMAMKRSLVEQIGRFDTEMGAGTRIGSGSDSEYVFRVLRSNRRILYSPHPVVYHNHNRSALSDVRRVRFAYAKGRGALYCKYLLRGDVWSGRALATEFVGSAIRLFTRREARVDTLLNLKGLFLGSAYRLFHESVNLLSRRKRVKIIRGLQPR
jgi:glycosyltransferase involved in cell wall biosynthesis